MVFSTHGIHSTCSELLTVPPIQQQSLLDYELESVSLEASRIRIRTQHLYNG
jgi:hypothetical protein